jgi:PadR family transcriptional regulator PadR
MLPQDEIALLTNISDYLHNAVHIMLGEFEYVLMTVAAGLGESAYGAAIREEIEKVAGRSCSIGALYTTIERLEKKGLLKTWMGEATAQRGGRAKRMVRVTPKGMHAAKEFYEAMMRVSRNASWATGKPERAS